MCGVLLCSNVVSHKRCITSKHKTLFKKNRAECKQFMWVDSGTVDDGNSRSVDIESRNPTVFIINTIAIIIHILSTWHWYQTEPKKLQISVNTARIQTHSTHIHYVKFYSYFVAPNLIQCKIAKQTKPNFNKLRVRDVRVFPQVFEKAQIVLKMLQNVLLRRVISKKNSQTFLFLPFIRRGAPNVANNCQHKRYHFRN